MSAKEAIHQLVDELPDEDADRVLAFLRAVSNDGTTGSDTLGELRVSESERAQLEQAKPFTFDAPLWGLIGIVDDDGPDDLAANHDKYLADIYAGLHRDE